MILKYNRQNSYKCNVKLILVINMKLGRAKYLIINTILFFLFIFIISSTTITFLYNNSNISKEEYLKLLLSDSYGDNFYINLVEIINKKFNPLNVIEMKKVNVTSFNLYNKENIENPIIYICNKNQNLEYKEEYNINPTVLLASFFLSENLRLSGVENIFEENNIENFSKNNNLSIEESQSLFMNDKKNNYPSIKYIINVGRVDTYSSNTTIKINNKKYALISLYANKDNISLITILNTKLNEEYNGISKIYFDNSNNDFINIDFGGKENTMKEVLNSIEVFSKIFVEVI